MHSASVRKKAVEIAKDVIKQIDSGFVKPVQGNWVTTDLHENVEKKEEELNKPNSLWNTECSLNEDASVQECIEKGLITKCEGCALGSMLISHIVKNNEVQVYDLHDINGFEDISDHLNEYFDQGDLDVIEAVFECSGQLREEEFYEDWSVSAETVAKYEKEEYGSGEYSKLDLAQEEVNELLWDISQRTARMSAKKVLKTLMNNVIKNKGRIDLRQLSADFKPKKVVKKAKKAKKTKKVSRR